MQIIDKLNSRQVVALNKIVDYDVFALASNGKNSVVNHTMIRGGKVVFSDNIAVTDAGLDEAQTLSSFLAEYCDMVKLCGEVCDLIYHLLVMCEDQSLPVSDIYAELEARSMKIGNLKQMKNTDRNT